MAPLSSPLSITDTAIAPFAIVTKRCCHSPGPRCTASFHATARMHVHTVHTCDSVRLSRSRIRAVAAVTARFLGLARKPNSCCGCSHSAFPEFERWSGSWEIVRIVDFPSVFNAFVEE